MRASSKVAAWPSFVKFVHEKWTSLVSMLVILAFASANVLAFASLEQLTEGTPFRFALLTRMELHYYVFQRLVGKTRSRE